jgi:indolepyruvate ferredoxin oxidoreductase
MPIALIRRPDMPLADVSLDDKYALPAGPVFASGIQALVRLPMEQRRRDLAAGLNTAGFISGYRGSPIAGYDLELWRAKEFLAQNHIHFQPGLNEDLAATAVWGSQQVNLFPGGRYDGVFSIWYGKAPGLDRSMDAVRHGHFAGIGKNGGVLLLVGDDHDAESSTLATQSEQNFAAMMMPVLHPSSVQEYIDYGLLGFAMSRFAGVWVGFKCLTETIDSSASILVDPARVNIVLPDDVSFPPDGLNIRLGDDRLASEARMHEYKIYAALNFARANRIDRVVMDSPKPRLGILTCGKSYLDVRQALADLGIDDRLAAEIGLRVYKAGMVWPLERSGARAFAEGLEEVLVIEEKRAVMENQLRAELYNWKEGVRPRIVGKFDEQHKWLMPSSGVLTPASVARVIAGRIARFYSNPRIDERVAEIEAKERALKRDPPKIQRTPYFCSGCPHNSSTKVPEGSRAEAGIGCHWMALLMNRRTETFSHMGGEGVNWIGQSPFTDENHVFVNLGDGTYHHSGILAIRAAVYSDVNATYKVLYNDAVAMTGGQPQSITPRQIAQQVLAEGAKKCVIVTDDIGKYAGTSGLPTGVTVHHRHEIDRIQRELREIPGVTVLVYDQTCAAELRRRRKRGTAVEPEARVIINQAVCEGCGDCSDKSNCVSVEPVETEFGRKRKINQSSCNRDYSCLDGFCPSFVTLTGATPRRAELDPAVLGDLAAHLPTPELPALDEPYNVLIAGIGGTGVVTIGALIGMAAHIEGHGVSVLDQVGLAQKNGAVVSHVRVADRRESIFASRIADGRANLLLGCDAIVAGGVESRRKIGGGVTRAVVNAHMAPTGAFTLDPDASFHETELLDSIRDTAGANLTEFVDATRIATALMGDSISTNLFLVGYAIQRGLIPVSLAAFERAIELNGIAVEANKQAVAWGRVQAVDPDSVAKHVERISPAAAPPAQSLDDIVAIRTRLLTDYQDAAYAARYTALVDKLRQAEQNLAAGRTGLAEAVARYAAKLMAYKDEYEVARLYASGDFAARLADRFEGDFKLRFHLAPPLIAKRDPTTGELLKREFGPWVMTLFRLLAPLKRLRGGTFDPFGRTAERRMERQLIEEYFALMDEISTSLTPGNHALAVSLASVPEHIRGYGPVKMRHLEAAKQEERRLLSQYRAGDAGSSAFAA